MGWGVTTSDVEQTTGKAVSATDLAMAEGSVEIYCNRTPSASGDMRPSDLHWLQTAIKWQAAWLSEQVDYVARMNVSAMSQDGVSSQNATPDTVTLAPLARRALKNLSWKAGRTLEMPSNDGPLGFIDITQENLDAYNRWQR